MRCVWWVNTFHTQMEYREEEEEHTTAASKLTARSSSGKSAFPKGKWTIPVLSALYSTFPCLNSDIAWNRW